MALVTRDTARAVLFLLFSFFSTSSKSAIRKFQITEEEVKPSLFADKKKKSLADQPSSLADLQIQSNEQKQKSIVFYYYYYQWTIGNWNYNYHM